ncbi:MAG TPA: pitrilysin family protein, partial [Sphingomonas sp.]|nr:pitrilysin family protein [Sphingomonas sp.]
MSIIRCVLGAAIAVVPASSLEGATPRPDDRAAAVTPSPSRLPAADMAAARRSILKMIDQVRLPVDSFTLSNGLRVLVHTDRSTPIVRVGVWYDVGSKHEPAGKSGFAHLFEHLMFNGSENVPGDYLPKLVSVGAEVNGNTSVDRTHYYEVVPTQALDRALFMESDRMGHLLGALRQATLDEQRGVVQNEKREGSSDPLAIVQDLRRAALYPASHPYGHSLIGSMKDLDAADLDDVRRFFKAHYGPNNAVLMLAGDVDVATAKRLVGKYFGTIPAGPRNMRPDAAPVLLERAIRQTTTAPVSLVSIVRSWPVPGRDSPASLALDGVAVALAGGPTSPLQTDLVRERRLFRGISARNLPSAQAGEFTISGTVMPGVDPQVAAAALDAELATFFKRGPSPEFVTRWVANTSYQTVRSLESMVVRAARMGEDAVMRGDPQAVKADLRFYAGLTPAAIAATARKWLDRPRWELTVTPGPRVTPPGDEGIDGSPASKSEPKASGSTVVTGGVAGATGPVTASDGQPGSRGPLPAVGAPKDPRFPTIEHARLANGIRVAYARWGGTPFTRVGLIVDGGGLNEAPEDAGTLSTMYSLLAKSFAGMSEDEVRQRLSLSGIGLSSGS